MADDNLIDAYLAERAVYDAAGRTDRVAQVDAELKRLGYGRAAQVKKAVKERAVAPKRETRG